MHVFYSLATGPVGETEACAAIVVEPIGEVSHSKAILDL